MIFSLEEQNSVGQITFNRFGVWLQIFWFWFCFILGWLGRRWHMGFNVGGPSSFHWFVIWWYVKHQFHLMITTICSGSFQESKDLSTICWQRELFNKERSDIRLPSHTIGSLTWANHRLTIIGHSTALLMSKSSDVIAHSFEYDWPPKTKSKETRKQWNKFCNCNYVMTYTSLASSRICGWYQINAQENKNILVLVNKLIGKRTFEFDKLCLERFQFWSWYR